MATLTNPNLGNYLAEQIKAKKTVTFDEIIFAYIPNLTESNFKNFLKMPTAAQIKYRFSHLQSAFVNNNQVVYSCTLDSTIGDFEFNFIGLINKADNFLAVAVQTDTMAKRKSSGTVQGNNLTRSILLEFAGAKNATNITIPAQSWQVDFSAQIKPKTINANTTNSVDLTGHTHEIAKASTATAGIVQLNNTLNSTSTTQALTAARGKVLNDRITAVENAANAKWTEVSATTGRKGIVQLNSAIDSTLENQAATPKAVKTAYDLAQSKAPTNNPEFTGTVKADYRILVERNDERYNPYAMMVNANIEQTKPIEATRLIGEYNTYTLKDGKHTMRSSLRTAILTDGEVSSELRLRTLEDANKIPWKSFSKTNNTVFGKTDDDGINRVQINGTATVAEPAANVNNNQIPNTKWVNSRLTWGNLKDKPTNIAYQDWVNGRLTWGNLKDKPTNIAYQDWVNSRLTWGNIANKPENLADQDWVRTWTGNYSSWGNIREKPDRNLVTLFKGEFHSYERSLNITVGSVNRDTITLAQPFNQFNYLVVVVSNDEKTFYHQNIAITRIIPITDSPVATFDLGGAGALFWIGRFISETQIRCIHENCVLHAIFGTNALY